MNQLKVAPNSALPDAEFKGKLTIALAAAIIQRNSARLLELSKILAENFSEDEIQKMWRRIKNVIAPQEEAWLTCVLTEDPNSCTLAA